MRTRTAAGLAAAALLAIAACSRAGINPRVEQEALTPPQPISGGGPLLVGGTPQSPVSIEIIVAVDTLGRADLATLQVTGTGADQNREIVREWLRGALFQPARLNGYLVRGWFHVAAEAKGPRARE